MLKVPLRRELVYEHAPSWSACSVGGRRRARNADAFAVRRVQSTLALAVADGVGSRPDSHVASEAAVASFSDWLASVSSVGKTMPMVELAVGSVHRAVGQALAQARKDADGATTLVAVLLRDDGCSVASIGDSEALSVNADGAWELLNPLDHKPDRPKFLTAWIDGEQNFTAHVWTGAPPFRLCLFTDGVSGACGHDRIAEIVLRHSASVAARELVLAAMDAGATDDLTAVVCSGLGS